MEEGMTVRVSDFSTTPGSRFRNDGEFSGEEFRDDILVGALDEAIAAKTVLTVYLDGVAGYGSSFLEEAFGGLFRLHKYHPQQIIDHLKIAAETDEFRPHAISAWKHINAAKSRELIHH